MKAAVISRFGELPRYAAFDEPVPEAGETVVQVKAAALSQLVRGHARGSHYSSGTKLPFIPGVDGVGFLPDGQRIYFLQPRAPYGSMAQRSVVRRELCIPVPEVLDSGVAAAIANPGMSSWAALTARVKLISGETVLINGATGSSGRLAIQIARHLGAARVVATGRNSSGVDSLLALGADSILSLDQPDEGLVQAFQKEIAEGVDIVLDYLWGHSIECLLKAVTGKASGRAAPRLRLIQIGSMAGPEISFPSAALRSSGVEVLGSGFGSLSTKDYLDSIRQLFDAVAPAKLTIETETAPLADVEAAWKRDTGGRRLVFTI